MKKAVSIFPKQFGFFPYIFLVYTIMPFLSLLKESGIKQVIGYGMLVLFVAAYRQLFCSLGRGSFTCWLIVQMAVIFIYSLFYDISYMYLGFFPANFVGYYREKTKFNRAFCGLIFMLLLPCLYQLFANSVSIRELFSILPFQVIMLISPFGIRSMFRRIELETKLDQANEQIRELSKREERVRIARDLHDTLGHTLSLLTLKSQLIQRLATSDPERTRLEAKEMETSSRAALKQVRELVSDMRTVTMTEELANIQHILKTGNITFQYEGDEDFSAISPVTQNIISMCMREAVTNIIKHSKATHCAITISQFADKMRIVIRDDGKGAAKEKTFGNGLRGMEERLMLIEGGLTLSVHNGTVLTLTIPLIKKAE
ncbi:sensor histidine kinase [Bacillus inaquosorum]|uniref:sensor histidine kinase n=1 Tax=Bacillus inaquosorum TaxID=483913 RepID=UPI000B56DCED|nr:sensor histidine kinase [Bacillus inaquosorum]ARV46515.1 two-component sensor histidine kinase [Bacillus subtilis]QJC90162.1 Two-component sensor histidine kinase (YvfU) [Bacillus subtilis]QYX42863.1 sensor histidine kinase [Bacillus inaquosorum]WNW23000.1 sensor histidine kinase [Bacillus inaquosorum]